MSQPTTRRIALSADNQMGLDAAVSPHFGRCPYYVLVDLAGDEVQGVSTVENPYYDAHQPGQVPAFIHAQGANVMITGGMGGRAIAFFEQYGIEPVTGAYGTVRTALRAYLGRELQGAAACAAHGAAHGAEHQAHATPCEGHHDEHTPEERLREEAEMLQQQLRELDERLNRLSKGS